MGEIARRGILDELSGAAEFDKRIGAANRELGEADKHEGEIKVVLQEIEARLISLEKEKEKALEYQALTIDRERLESELFVLDVLDAQAKAPKKAAEVRAHETRAAELADELVQAEKDSKEAKEALEAIDAEIAKKAEGEQVEKVREVETVRANVAHAADPLAGSEGRGGRYPGEGPGSRRRRSARPTSARRRSRSARTSSRPRSRPGPSSTPCFGARSTSPRARSRSAPRA